MQILFWVFVIIGAYFLIVFVGLRLAVPFMGFGGLKKPKEIPAEMRNKIAELEGKATSQMKYLELAYEFVVNHWEAGRMDTIYFAYLAFRNDLTQIWHEEGYAHCNTQNYILFVLLTGSNFFKPEDLELKTVFFNFFIHQYLRVKLDGRWMDVDPAGASIRGLDLGKHISFFG